MIRCKKLVDELHHLMERYMSNNATPDADLYLSKMSVLFEEIDERDNFARRLRAHNVYNEQQVVEELAIPLIHGLISEIEDAFHCSPVLAGFSIFNLNNVPDSLAELQDFGNNEPINSLAKHYGNRKEDHFQGHTTEAHPRYTEAAYIAEFQAFKHQMFMLKLVSMI